MRKTQITAVAWWLGMLVASACHAAVPGANASTAPGEWVDDLRPITAADWTRERAAHLLERAGFGALPAVTGQDPATLRLTTLGEEKQFNTFLRLTSPGIIAALREAFPELPEQPDPKTVFVKLRELRNAW